MCIRQMWVFGLLLVKSRATIHSMLLALSDTNTLQFRKWFSLFPFSIEQKRQQMKAERRITLFCFLLAFNSRIPNSNNNRPEYTKKSSNPPLEKTKSNSIDNNECDSGGSSLVVDDEPQSSSLNSSTEENRDELENHIGDSKSTTKRLAAASAAVAATSVANDWDLYCKENFATVNPMEEKIYEDLCYVTFSTNLPEVENFFLKCVECKKNSHLSFGFLLYLTIYLDSSFLVVLNFCQC